MRTVHKKVVKHMLFSRDIGIDLGTATTSVCVKGKGIIMREPSVVAYDVRTDQVKAVGTAAKEMIGRTPGSIVAVRPLKNGVIADFDVTAAMLTRFIKDSQKGSLFSRTRVVVSIPAGVTEVESRAVYDAVKQAGGSEVDLLEVPVAAAIGAGLPINEPTGFMIVDIGGGTTEIAIISLGGIVTAQSVRQAGDQMDEAIMNYVRRKHRLVIGERTAEEIKIKLGSATSYQGEGKMEISGRNVDESLPRSVVITASEVRDALRPVIDKIIDAIKNTLEKTPPELAADILNNGITLTGSGAELRGLAGYISSETEFSVAVAENPGDCVVLGTLKKLDEESGLDSFVFRRGKQYR